MCILVDYSAPYLEIFSRANQSKAPKNIYYLLRFYVKHNRIFAPKYLTELNNSNRNKYKLASFPSQTVLLTQMCLFRDENEVVFPRRFQNLPIHLFQIVSTALIE